MPANCEALLAFYEDAGGADWYDDSGWLVDADYCTWFGITCGEDGAVTEIVMGGNNLRGTLNAKLGDLNELRLLTLPDQGDGGRGIRTPCPDHSQPNSENSRSSNASIWPGTC